MFSPLAPSVFCIVPFRFSHVLLPFVTTPGLLLPPPSSPVPRLFISVCVFSVCVSFTPCLVVVAVSSCLPCSCACSCLLLSNVFLDSEFCIFPFDLNFTFYLKLKLAFYFPVILASRV